MSKYSPVISVIIPVYNVEKYIDRCLNSVLNQSFNDIEIICIDDGSTDSSLSILHRYAAKDERIRIFTQRNRGASAARNAGLDAANGQWISFVDSDDEIHPDMYKTLLAHTGYEDAVYFSAEEFIRDGNNLKNVSSDYFKVKFSGIHVVTIDEISHFSMVVWDKLFLREKIESINLRFPEGLCFEDNAFIINFFSLHHKVRFVQKKLYRYFRRTDSITGMAYSKKTGIAFDYIHILDEIHSFWRKWELLPENQPLFEQFCVFYFRAAISICQAWERPGLVYEMARSMYNWNMTPKNNILSSIKNGLLSLRIGKFPGKDVTMLKKLKGFEKILYIGNCNNMKIVCIFSIKIASWRRKIYNI
ncbi:glycosyltransferase [uncultured Mailhella sp.]|uniref:glycosyltransferase family 2 protein n=1 Tax=uncultured Mailhella sp. TaxID=1981031 RepID=UPI002600BE0A|nr:glycosyltransferase [uncultured Mailhella sp.]